ncbi:methyltransferase type 11 [Streptomyces sp. CB03234]|uniref:class I SAM-dependent methyltransferase n=1 Tax=Streptomyces sp. (strain CB03234) TaxID=1703937 RepID=UPI0009399680|nr:class I SAM-dependent methyltransferase [Streptomyces sp. CB03234]OKK04761.1 methyltransferase type 11 [Streptomyces sp. CB03234]DAC74145.1 TPA_exp: methyltransferase [Streptomyces sp. CB03234]
MPTLPENQPHRQRQVAESFGTDAERYDRARPRYPEALVERIVADSPGVTVLDVGSGTGIAARQFQAHDCTVLAVEPDERLAELARQLGVETDVATFEAWEPAGREFDAVVAAQAWHWVDPVAGAAKAARVLRPAGRLAVFWNVFQFPPDVADVVAEVCERVMPNAPFSFTAMTKGAMDGYQEFFAKSADGIRTAGGFGEPEQWRYDWEWTYTKDAWLDQMPTLGAFTRLPEDKMAEVLRGVGDAIDAMGGSFTMGYATVAVTARRTDAP